MSRFRSSAAAVVVAAGLVSGVLPLAAAFPAAGSTPSSAASTAVTKSGTGRFADLEVTVSQTTNMRNQVVRVSWSGGQPSGTNAASFFSNYLQIMQCWADEGEVAPVREQCQFGGLFGDNRGGQATATREIVNNGQYDDEKEKYKAPFPASAVVPFKSVTGKTVTDRKNEFFDSLSTNEIPYGRTSADGTGEDFFEVQTAREAAGLGCGARLAAGKVRHCWLVVVPRDDVEVNGLKLADLPAPALQTSPLSATNFANAIAFKLQFEPVGVACPLGAEERRLLGSEDIAEAVTRWQPKLCGVSGSIFGFSQIGDDAARRQVLSDAPWMSLVGAPLHPEQVTDGRKLTYAPLAVNAIGLGLVVERDPRESAPDDVKARRGTRVLDLKLNARLVAKLLTQSYQTAVTGDRKHVEGNPRWLADDPEFLLLNPEFENLQYIQKLYSITNPLGLSDANHTLWEWIARDAQARKFINGQPDPWGAEVNPYYEGMNLDRMDFPRSDPTCVTFAETLKQAPLCALEWLAYAADFHAAASAAIRGLTLANASWDPSSSPPRYKQDPPQPTGERAVLIVVDTATAARYEVPLARLENGAGEYVAPTEVSMRRALAGMTDEVVEGVLEPHPDAEVEGAYPLTQVIHAVTAPRQLTTEEAKAYAAFVRFAAGPGQTPGIAPGQLPAGYLPLPKTLRQEAMEAADVIEARARTPKPPVNEPTPSPPSPTADAPSSTPTPAEPAVPGPVPSAVPTVTLDPPPLAVAATPTPAVSPGSTRWALLVALVMGLLAALARPAWLIASRLTSRGGTSPTTST